MLFPLLILLFIVLPIAEVYLIIKVGQAIGPWWTILILVADAVIGAQLLRWQGRTVWRRLQATLAQNRLPHKEILDGAFVIIGGTLLLTPGFITDIFGILFLIPPTRALIRNLTLRFLTPGGMARFVFVRARPVASSAADRYRSPEPPRHVEQPQPKELPPE